MSAVRRGGVTFDRRHGMRMKRDDRADDFRKVTAVIADRQTEHSFLARTQ